MKRLKTLSIIAIGVAISACFNMDSYLTIKGPDHVDYRVVISTPSETSFIIDAIKDSLGKFDKVETTVRNDTTYLTAEINGIPIDSLTGFGFEVEKVNENTYRIWQEKTSSDTTNETDEMFKDLLGKYRMTLTVVVENGKVLEHNADEVKGNTYFWKTTLDRAAEFTPSITIQFQKKAASSNLWPIIGLFALLIGTGVFFFLKRK